ncbi:MAG: phosphoenolpyruvate carboxykinase (ATP) [Chloroflexi bacterium]|jgi:phosphoenolpyruvate carboxykinase (ATP)|nr:phosphoenolpyruvate carboxykinase (ATP) [Anaerolineaceae bacterium]NMB87088.1 phosphoenolpyruvate carboxykinase (ATP) [Chloroflexota bacterium]
MQNLGTPSADRLEGFVNLRKIYWNLPPPALIEETILRKEGSLTTDGAIVVYTGQHTGRSPGDKFIVEHESSFSDQVWWGNNQKIKPEHFDQIHKKMAAYLQGKDVFVQDLLAGAHPKHRLAIRVITEKAWQSLFAFDLFIRLAPHEIPTHVPEYTLLCCPDFLANPEEDSTRSGTFILIDFRRKMVLIGGTSYAGEIKKAIFTVMNYVLPQSDILSMHCAANVGKKGDVALFFGLSGTGKTTLSSDPERQLIGDDEHGWSDEGVFNIEGGCYAKTIRLQKELEPIIWKASRRYGSVLENVAQDETSRTIDFDDSHYTENTRAAYPLHYVSNIVPSGYAGHPQNIFFLTADAFGVLPPIALLSQDQVLYYFLSGYTSKLAGTEKDLGVEPVATFSTCFGAPFLPIHPDIYASLLYERITRRKIKVWLVNTGWTGGPYGRGTRIKLTYTRAMIDAALTHKFDHVTFRQSAHFGLSIPQTCPRVPDDILDPVSTWKDRRDYDQLAHQLVGRFENYFEHFTSTISSLKRPV